MASNYTRGQMDISAQRGMFEGSMKAGVSCTLITAYTVLFLTLAFGVGTGWFTALGAGIAVGLVGGVIMKQGPWYWLTLVALSVIAGITGGLIALFAS